MAFAWQAWDNVHCQGVGCTPRCPPVSLWRPLVSAALPVAFAWHIYVPRHAQHEHSTYTSSQHHIPKHHLTHHNFTSHATRSVYLRLHLPLRTGASRRVCAHHQKLWVASMDKSCPKVLAQSQGAAGLNYIHVILSDLLHICPALLGKALKRRIASGSLVITSRCVATYSLSRCCSCS